MRCSLFVCRYSCTCRTSSPPSDIKTTCWFSCIPCDIITFQTRCRGFWSYVCTKPKHFGGGTVFFRPPERHHTAARDHFEIPLLVGRSHVAAVDTHRHGTVRQGEFSDRLHGGKITGLSLFS